MPYKYHPEFRLPAQRDGPLWRYMDFTKFIAMLDRSELYFPSIHTLTAASDPYEGSFSDSWKAFIAIPYSLLPEGQLDALGIKGEQQWQEYVGHILASLPAHKKMHQRIYVNSWHF